MVRHGTASVSAQGKAASRTRRKLLLHCHWTLETDRAEWPRLTAPLGLGRCNTETHKTALRVLELSTRQLFRVDTYSNGGRGNVPKVQRNESMTQRKAVHRPKAL